MKNQLLRYTAYNKSRLHKAAAFNQQKYTFLFKVVPLLLHCNYQDLPGFVEDSQCPFGIHLFQPEEVVDAELFRRYFPTSTARSIKTDSPYPQQPCIHSLKTIGSIGTIAQTEISDCDYWISIRHQELGPSGLSLLARKCQGIEEWALKRGMEIHFFLMDIDQTRENRFESRAEKESAGSALKVLLKDELFRTHILVAGKMLLWWLIPPGLSEEQYKAYVAALYDGKKINPDAFIDLGYLTDIPKSEIFGACLWQMNKALDSPFKSVIKFAYLELLLRNSDQSLPLFSDKIKCLVTFPEDLLNERDKVPLEDVDPYLLLARDIVAFYSREDTDARRDEFIKACLYLKTLEGMASQKKNRDQDDHLEAILSLMENWQLLPGNYEHFADFGEWKYKELLEFGYRVHEYLIETYKKLRWIFKTFGQESAVAITQRDLSVLGRKLFTFYEKKPLKVEYIRSISREIMGQRDITFHITRYEGVDYYYAFQGEHDLNSIKANTDRVIKRETEPVTLVVWLLVNGIISPKTRLHLTKNFLPLDLADIQLLVQALFKTFPPVHFAHISARQLVQPETTIRALVVVNMSKAPVKGARTLDSTVITTNSYGEYFIHHFQTVTQLKNMMRQLLTKHFVSRWNKNLDIFIPHQPEQHHIKTLLDL